jgi:hypothetical protein
VELANPADNVDGINAIRSELLDIEKRCFETIARLPE